MRMTYGEIVQHVNALNGITAREADAEQKWFDGTAMLYIRRNTRAMMLIYDNVYDPMRVELWDEFYEMKEVPVIMPDGSDAEEKRKISALRKGADEDEYKRRLKSLLDQKVDVKIHMLPASMMRLVDNIDAIDALDFMVE